MGKLQTPSAPPITTPYVEASAVTPIGPVHPSVTAEVVNGVAYGQTLYFRQVQRSCPHKFALCINITVIGSSVGLGLGQIWGMAVKNVGVLEAIMRTYLIAVSGVIVLNELEASSLLTRSPVLQKFTWRGFFYTFIGSLGALLNDIGNDDYYNHWNRYKNRYQNNGGYVTFTIPTLEHFVEIFIEFTSIILFLMGCLYILMGVLWVQGKIEREIDGYRERLNFSEQAMAGEQDVMRRRFGGRLGEEVGLA